MPSPAAASHPQVEAAAGGWGVELAEELARLPTRALRLLRDSGAADPACQIAAAAWRASNRAQHPAAQQFTGLLHYLSTPNRAEGAPAIYDTDKVLDVRQEIPARRHHLIF